MLPVFDGLRTVTLASVTVRMLLAVLCGGIIGIERAYKRRPAGFRTHILICLGAAITTLTSQYLYLNLHYYTDMARLGAQVVAGIGFIGAGTIVVTRQQRVKGLTTAAGSTRGPCWPRAWCSSRNPSSPGWNTGCWTTCRRSTSIWSTPTNPPWRRSCGCSGKTGSLCRTWRSPALPATKTTTPAPFSPCGSARAPPWTIC